MEREEKRRIEVEEATARGKGEEGEKAREVMGRWRLEGRMEERKVRQ